MIEVDLRPLEPNSQQLWANVGELVSLLPHDWVLIGGLMVQLHALEHGIHDVRATVDIDVLGQARPPGALPAIDRALLGDDFIAAEPDADGYAHRYERKGIIVDVLAPDGVQPPPELGGGRIAVGVPGGSQALARSEEVRVHLPDQTFALRRPNLLGAILIKARSLVVHHDPESQREDLLMLLSLLEDPRAARQDLKISEQRWIRRSEKRLEFSSTTPLSPARVQRARLAFSLLHR